MITIHYPGPDDEHLSLCGYALRKDREVSAGVWTCLPHNPETVTCPECLADLAGNPVTKMVTCLRCGAVGELPPRAPEGTCPIRCDK